MFQSDITSVLDNFKAKFPQGKNMPYLRLMKLQINHREYQIFWALFYFRIVCLKIKFGGNENLLGVLMQYEILNLRT